MTSFLPGVLSANMISSPFRIRRFPTLELIEDLFVDPGAADLFFSDFQLARLSWLEQRLESLDTVEPPPHAEIAQFFEARRERN